MSDPRDGFRGKSYILLTSFKKDGGPVTTQMWFVLDNGRLFVRSDSTSLKVKRLQRNPIVNVAPCGVKKKSVGEVFPARALRLQDSDGPRIARLYRRKYPIGYNWEVAVLRPFYNAMAKLHLHRGRGEPIFYEIVPEQVSPEGQLQSSASGA